MKSFNPLEHSKKKREILKTKVLRKKENVNGLIP